ncbi:MAG: methylmalonyl Co-A mutase-associated GTPase MeaB [Planctomycetota bacterium]
MDKSVIEKVLSGDKRSVAKLISAVENEPGKYEEVMDLIFPHSLQAHRVGITGPPGSGKSTLVDALTESVRKNDNLSVGIIAIDPSSPFTHGALLGDRIRMRRIGLDNSVFIRSMATRGALGGLCAAASDTADILAASGKQFVITETVGVGQSEVEIAQIADTCIVVLCPGSGDTIQTLKAGLMEIGEIFVVNKADHEGANQLLMDIRTTLELREHKPDEWLPVVLQTVATEGHGINELRSEIKKHRDFLSQYDRLNNRRRKAIAKKIRGLVRYKLESSLYTHDEGELLSSLSKSVLEGKVTLYEAVKKIFGKVNKI